VEKNSNFQQFSFNFSIILGNHSNVQRMRGKISGMVGRYGEKMQKRIVDFGIKSGELQAGRLNKISDVPGVRVGHCSIDTQENKTGVSVILPGEDFIFNHKLPAAVSVLNGFGKSLGLMQIEELGNIETPIYLTNTLNVGLVHDAAVSMMIEEAAKNGGELLSVNPVVFECNDSFLNRIQNRVIHAEHVRRAVESAAADFDEGDVGAGKGMSCFQLKGGIGSASRVIQLDSKTYTLGLLVLSNFGLLKDLRIAGKPAGEVIARQRKNAEAVDRGSIILVYATDAPLTSRQIKRVIQRGAVGLARLGSYTGHFSGEVMLGFSTAYTVSSERDIFSVPMVNENRLDVLFRAAAECAEEAVLNSMVCAQTVVGYRGNVRESLAKYLDHEEGLLT
jgi:D-aminopeptidase